MYGALILAEFTKNDDETTELYRKESVTDLDQ